MNFLLRLAVVAACLWQGQAMSSKVIDVAKTRDLYSCDCSGYTTDACQQGDDGSESSSIPIDYARCRNICCADGGSAARTAEQWGSEETASIVKSKSDWEANQADGESQVSSSSSSLGGSGDGDSGGSSWGGGGGHPKSEPKPKPKPKSKPGQMPRPKPKQKSKPKQKPSSWSQSEPDEKWGGDGTQDRPAAPRPTEAPAVTPATSPVQAPASPVKAPASLVQVPTESPTGVPTSITVKSDDRETCDCSIFSSNRCNRCINGGLECDNNCVEECCIVCDCSDYPQDICNACLAGDFKCENECVNACCDTKDGTDYTYNADGPSYTDKDNTNNSSEDKQSYGGYKYNAESDSYKSKTSKSLSFVHSSSIMGAIFAFTAVAVVTGVAIALVVYVKVRTPCGSVSCAPRMKANSIFFLLCP
jgi:hypothetical protein